MYEIKKNAIKICTCYYFDGIISINDIDLANTLVNERSYGKILIYIVAYKIPYGSKDLHVIFNKVEGYIRKYDKTRYLALFHSDKNCQRFFDRIRYHLMLKYNISEVYSHKFMESKVNSDDNLPLEKSLDMHNVIILTDSVFHENYNQYYYQEVLEHCSYK